MKLFILKKSELASELFDPRPMAISVVFSLPSSKNFPSIRSIIAFAMCGLVPRGSPRWKVTSGYSFIARSTYSGMSCLAWPALNKSMGATTTVFARFAASDTAVYTSGDSCSIYPVVISHSGRISLYPAATASNSLLPLSHRA